MSGLDTAEEPRDWIFTFGFGQPNVNCFARIHGTFNSAREEMFARFGRVWSMQYKTEEEAGVEEFGLQEIDLKEKMPPAI